MNEVDIVELTIEDALEFLGASLSELPPPPPPSQGEGDIPSVQLNVHLTSAERIYGDVFHDYGNLRFEMKRFLTFDHPKRQSPAVIKESLECAGFFYLRGW